MRPPGTRAGPWVARVAGSVLIAGISAGAAPDEPPPPMDIAPPSEAASVEQSPIIQQEALQARLATDDPGLVVLDVRTPAEYAAGHIPGALNIEHDRIAERLAELASARGKDIVVYCRTGRRSAPALKALREAGFNRLAHLEGDFVAWEIVGRPIKRPESQ